MPGNQGETDGGSWCAICDSVLELNPEVMIRNQNKQDNQYFLLTHVESRLSERPGPLETSEGSEQQQRGSGHQGRIHRGLPTLVCASSAPRLAGQGKYLLAPNCQCEGLSYTKQTVRGKAVIRQNPTQRAYYKCLGNVWMNSVPLIPTYLLTHISSGV